MANQSSKAAPAALIVGAIAGAAAALLLTPKSGEENRKALAKTLDEMKTKLGEQEFTQTIRDYLGSAQDSGTKLYEKAHQHLDEKLGEFNDYLDKKRYEQVVDDVVAKLKTKSKDAAEKVDKVRASLMDEWDDRKKHFLTKSRSNQSQSDT